MVQNRNKLIDLFIGNIANSIVHEILEKAAKENELISRYRKELTTSFEIAKKYRNKINPISSSLPDKDNIYIKSKIIRKVRAELSLRISKGYENIDLGLVEELVNKALKDTKIVEDTS